MQKYTFYRGVGRNLNPGQSWPIRLPRITTCSFNARNEVPEAIASCVGAQTESSCYEPQSSATSHDRGSDVSAMPRRSECVAKVPLGKMLRGCDGAGCRHTLEWSGWCLSLPFVLLESSPQVALVLLRGSYGAFVLPTYRHLLTTPHQHVTSSQTQAPHPKPLPTLANHQNSSPCRVRLCRTHLPHTTIPSDTNDMARHSRKCGQGCW